MSPYSAWASWFNAKVIRNSEIKSSRKAMYSCYLKVSTSLIFRQSHEKLTFIPGRTRLGESGWTEMLAIQVSSRTGTANPEVWARRDSTLGFLR